MPPFVFFNEGYEEIISERDLFPHFVKIFEEGCVS